MTAHEDVKCIIADDTDELAKITQLMMKMWECRKVMEEVHDYAVKDASYSAVQDAREAMGDWYATWGEMFRMLKVRSEVLKVRLTRASKIAEILSEEHDQTDDYRNV